MKVWTEKPSGNTFFDQSALRAIAKANPLPPVPEGYGEESWWRFPGWQIVFAGIASFYFAMVLAWLPLLVAKKGKGEAH